MSAEPLALPSFGLLLRRYRTAAGLTQEELAARAGLSARAISDLERGVKLTPRRDTVNLLGEALALPPRKRTLLAAAARPTTERMGAADLPDAALAPHNLPAQLTTLIGREREALGAAELLARTDVRLLTLTGTGGVGKTRLALQVAEEALGRFEDGVFAVMLAPLRDSAFVLPSIAAVLELRTAPHEPLARRLSTALRDRELLLVLDNFEHVLAAAPDLAALLAACPRVKALVTSREPLRIAGEHELPVGQLADDAAVELFVRRAQAAHPALELTAADLDTVKAICRRVDRLPLAIELAAVWTKVLPLPALLERLASPLALLTGGRRDAPAHQRSLRETIAWSEQLLAADEQQLFRRLAVFAGSFTPEAVDAICATAEAAAHASTLAGLASLVEKGLLQAETPSNWQDEGPRFWTLETIRDFANERLLASGEAEDMRRRHAVYYAHAAEKLGWVGAGQDERDRQLALELPNARAALGWARERGATSIGLRLAVALGRFWYSRGDFDEGEEWLRSMLALDAEAVVWPALAPLRVMALYFRTLYALDRRDYDRGEALAREGLAVARQHGDVSGAGNMLTELGHVAEARGDLDAAMSLFEESLVQYRAGGERLALGRTLSSVGNLARARGDYVSARRYLEEALDWARKLHFSWAIASILTSLGHVAAEQGDAARARPLYRESLELYRGMRNPSALAWCLEGVAVVAEEDGRHERAAQLCGAVSGLRAAAGIAEASAAWTPFARASEAARQALGEEGFAAAQAAGAALSPERAIAYALAERSARARKDRPRDSIHP